MLLHQPPFVLVDRLTLYPDHLDPDTYYYVVSVPELARDRGEPAWWATAILSAVRVTGPAPDPDEDVARVQLSFDTSLAPTEAELEAARQALVERRGREKVRVVPAPLHAGKAVLTVARPATEEAERELFVHSGHAPSLVGDNRAAFAVAAEGREAQILAASVQAGHLAAVVAYELELLGLTPAFHARMTVHWSLVYAHFTERAVDNFVFYSDQLEETVDSLTRSQAVEVVVEELDPEVKAEATKALWNELKTEVVKKLFEPAFTAGDTPVEERIGRGVREVVTSLIPGSHHALRRLDQHALATTVIDLREQGTRVFRHQPQTTLAGMLARAGVPAELAVARLDDLPDRVEEIRVEAAPDLAEVGIRHVSILVEARDAAGDLLAEQAYTLAAGDRAAPEVFRFRRRGDGEPTVRWRADVDFAPGHAPDDAARWSSAWQDVTGRRVYFSPAEWLDVTSVRVEVDDPAIFALPASVEMRLEARLPGAARAFRTDDLIFTSDHPSRTFTTILPRGVVVGIGGVEVLRRPNEPEVRREVPAIDGPVHRIRNPFARAWRMEVRAAADWTSTEALVAELRVWEPQRRAWLVDEHRFTQAAPTYTLAFATAPDTPQEAQARLTRVTRDGNVVRGPWLDLAGRVARITDAVEAIRRIRVTLHAPRLADAHVRRVSVELAYTGADGAADGTTLTFSRDGQHHDWHHALPDPARSLYRWRASAIGEHGERWSHPWTETATDDLTIELPDDPFSG